MRKADGKEYGYIVLPVAVPAGVDAAANSGNRRRRRCHLLLTAVADGIVLRGQHLPPAVGAVQRGTREDAHLQHSIQRPGSRLRYRRTGQGGHSDDAGTGAVTITVTVIGSDGISVERIPRIAVEPPPAGLLRGWGRVLLEELRARSRNE